MTSLGLIILADGKFNLVTSFKVEDYRTSIIRGDHSSLKSNCSKEEIILVIVGSILLFSIGILFSINNGNTELFTLLYDGVNSILFGCLYWSGPYSIAFYIIMASVTIVCLIILIAVKVKKRKRYPDWFLNLM